jgi:hypothetical protein
MLKSPKTAIGGLCVVVVAVAAAPAEAQTTFPRASFNVLVEGVQTTTWATDHDDPFGACGAYFKGSGRERMTFKTAKPVRVRATKIGRYLTFTIGRRPASFLARAVINRSGTLTVTPHPGECAGGGGGGSPTQPPPDCGRKVSSIDIALQQSFRRRTAIVLADGGLTPLVNYRNCPASGTVYPNLLTTTTGGRPVEASMPASDLLDPDQRKHITIGRGTFVSNGGGTSTRTTVRWTVTFTRIGH